METVSQSYFQGRACALAQGMQAAGTSDYQVFYSLLGPAHTLPEQPASLQ